MKIRFTPFLFILALLISSCAQSPTPQQAITLTDGLGRSVTLAQPAQRVISLAASNTEMLFALGAGGQVIARDSFSDYPQAALALPDIGGGFGDYDLERIAALKPDLVLAAQLNTPAQVQALQDLGLTVYYLANPNDLEDMFAMLTTVATLTGHQSEAETLVKDLRARVKLVEQALASADDRPLVYYELDASDPAKPFTPGKGTFYSAIIAAAGGLNLGEELDAQWAQIGLETLLVRDPQFILLGDALWGVTAESVAARSGWDQLTAVKEGRVLPVDDNLLSRPGPRQVDGLEVLARLIHPELFK